MWDPQKHKELSTSKWKVQNNNRRFYSLHFLSSNDFLIKGKKIVHGSILEINERLQCLFSTLMGKGCFSCKINLSGAVVLGLCL